MASFVSSKALKGVLNSFPVGIAIIGMTGTIVAWDKKSEKLFNLSEKDAIGTKLSDYFPNAQKILEKYLDTSSKSRRTRKRVFKRQTNNSYQHIEIVFSDLKKDNGRIGVMLVFRDVTKEVISGAIRVKTERQNKELLKKVDAHRERLRTLIANIPGVVWEAEGEMGKLEFEMKYISRFVEKMLGYNLKDLTTDSKKVLSAIDKEDFLKVSNDFQKVEKSKRKRGITQFRLTKSDGKKIWTETQFAILDGSKPDSNLITGVTFDIDARKKAEELVEKSEERYRTLFELAPDVIYVIDKEGRFEELNPAFEAVTGFKREEWIGRTYKDLTHPDDRDFAKKKFDEGIVSEIQNPYELRVLTKSGKYITAEFRSKPRVIDGKVKGKLGVYRDISERRHQELQRSYMLGIASHELKTPLASIKVFTQILEKQFLKEGNIKNISYLAKIDQQINKLTKLISDLLDVERIKAGKLEVAYEIFEFDKLIDEVVNDLKTTITHQIIVKGKTNRYIRADRERISRVIGNLLTNASKYSPGKDKIIVLLSSNSKNVTVGIKDFGLGIGKDSKDKIFEPYYHSNANNKRRIPSVGLGLYISSELVRAHGGKLWVESETKKGSVFFLSLPIKAATQKLEVV